ncbi:MAG: hypothetical protein ACI8UO_001737 [Verrucomicrobiales bacterium]|jgi:hypothetical protein
MSSVSIPTDSATRLDSFDRFRVSKDAADKPIKLPAPEGEIVLLASDPVSDSLIELHFPKTQPDSGEAFASRLTFAKKLPRDAAFVSVLESLEFEGELAYTTHVNQGEPLDSYVERNGCLAPTLALGLAVELLEQLAEGIPRFERLLLNARLSNVLVFKEEDSAVRFRVIDFNLISDSESAGSLSSELRGLLGIALTGFRPEDRIFSEILSGPLGATLPSNAAAILSGGRFEECSVEQLLTALREDLNTITSLSDRNRREHLRVCRQTSPHSAIESALMPMPAMPEELSSRFIADWRGVGFDNAFAISAMDSTNGGRVRVQILPPGRVHEAAPSASPQSEDTQQLLKVLEAWEGDNATWVAEEGWPGFSLSLVLATKGRLSATETLIALRQVAIGIAQARKHRVEIPDLRPANLLICFPASTNQSDLRRSLGRRLDCWSSFVIKLRVHATTRSLLEPPHAIELALVNASVDDSEDERLKRRFLALAIELLTGGTGELPTESLPAAVMDLFVECGRKTQSGEKMLEPAEFLEQFAAALPEAPLELDAVTWTWADYSNAKSPPIPIPAPAAADSSIEIATIVPSPFAQSELVNAHAVPAPERSAVLARAPEPVELELEPGETEPPRRRRRAPVIAQSAPFEIEAEFSPFNPAPLVDEALTDPAVADRGIALAPLPSGSAGRLGKVFLGVIQMIAIVILPVTIFIGFVQRSNQTEADSEHSNETIRAEIQTEAPAQVSTSTP